MSKDAKSKLKEKMGAAVSDEDLEKVAGGTLNENKDILNALQKIDPNGVKHVFDSVKIGMTETEMKNAIDHGTAMLLAKHGILSTIDYEAPNSYTTFNNDGDLLNHDISHQEVLNKINQKAKAMLGR